MFATVDLSKRSWLNTPTSKIVKEKKTKAAGKKIKWSLFVEMANREHDTFWKDYWIRASKGTFPSGFTFNGKELCYSYRNRYTKAVVNDNIVEMCQLMKSVMQEKGNIYSPADLKRIATINGLNNNVDTLNSWSSCNSSQKANLLSFFLLDLAEEYSLSKREIDELDQTLNVGVNIGAFNNKNIIVEDNKIVEIIGLDWNEESGKFFINTNKSPFKIKKPAVSSSKKSNPYCFLTEWEKINKPKCRKKVNEVDITNVNTSVGSCYYE